MRLNDLRARHFRGLFHTLEVAATVFGVMFTGQASLLAQEEPGRHHCDLRATLGEQGKNWGIRVEGGTNLPDGTEILISVLYDEETVETGWTRVYVKGPSFSRDIGPFTERPFAGDYTVRASCDLARQDPGPYLALQDEGDLQFETILTLGEKETELKEDRAFLDWITKARSGLSDLVRELRDMFQRAADKKEFRTLDGGFDAQACVAWTDRWISRAKAYEAGAESFRGKTFAPKYPKWIRTMAETISTIIQYGCSRAAQCFQANGVPPPPRYNAGGGAVVEEKDSTTVPVLNDLDPIVTALTEKIARLEKESHAEKSPSPPK